MKNLQALIWPIEEREKKIYMAFFSSNFIFFMKKRKRIIYNLFNMFIERFFVCHNNLIFWWDLSPFFFWEEIMKQLVCKIITHFLFFFFFALSLSLSLSLTFSLNQRSTILCTSRRFLFLSLSLLFYTRRKKIWHWFLSFWFLKKKNFFVVFINLWKMLFWNKWPWKIYFDNFYTNNFDLFVFCYLGEIRFLFL